ncbi:MAG: HEPN domain-containing protein [Deltaproteobacteria bacterium]|nr:HEPN domain-containing protein [Deltaproteobacteria bacterium]
MNEATREAVTAWVKKAESDWEMVTILSSHESCPRDAVYSRCQQHVEKLLKALLTLHGIEAPRTHNLRRLVQMTKTVSKELPRLEDSSDILTIHGVASTYPDDWREITADEMFEVIKVAREFLSVLLPELQIPDKSD